MSRSSLASSSMRTTSIDASSWNYSSMAIRSRLPGLTPIPTSLRLKASAMVAMVSALTFPSKLLIKAQSLEVRLANSDIAVGYPLSLKAPRTAARHSPAETSCDGSAAFVLKDGASAIAKDS